MVLIGCTDLEDQLGIIELGLGVLGTLKQQLLDLFVKDVQVLDGVTGDHQNILLAEMGRWRDS